jgi:DNA-binding NarL/FixJ family response regulator
MILAGKNVKGIALQLGLSIHTVREHLQFVYRKLGVHGRDELMAMFISKPLDGHMHGQPFVTARSRKRRIPID